MAISQTIIYPELGETSTAEIQYVGSCTSGYIVTTDLELKGRGIKLSGDGSDHKRGKKTYRVTERALEILKTKYSYCYLANL